MAKDPAFLFYPGDFLGGTQTFTRAEKGAYMDLMILQFNEGHLMLNDITRCLNSDFETMWPFLKKKFKVDEKGLFYNERLEKEIEKRKKYSQSRRENIEKRYTCSTYEVTHVVHMENENRNTNTIDSKEGLLRENLIKEDFSFDYTTEIPQKTLEASEQNQFTKTKKKNTDFVLSQWKLFLYERMADPPEKLKEYKQIGDLTRYFLNWIRDKHPNNGTHKQTPNGQKLGTSEARIEKLTTWGRTGA